MLAGERSGRGARLIRVAPPLVITKADIDESVGILEKVLRGLQL
jgi:4-aminobutyrate aminotransferase-like enzyme